MALFFKRKINKNAVEQPAEVADGLRSTISMPETIGTAFNNIDMIATSFALLNFGVYDNKTKEKVRKHPIYNLLREPNLDDRHFNFFYQSAVDYFNGGCIWLKAKVAGDVVSLFRLDPKRVMVDRDYTTRRRIYRYNGRIYTSDDILYIPARFDYSTLTGGRDIFSSVKSVFDTAKDIEVYTQNKFQNGVDGERLVVDITKAFPDATDEQIKKIKDKIQAEYGGTANAGRPLLKYKGYEYSTVGTKDSSRSADLASNRGLQREEICNVFQVPTEKAWNEAEYTKFYSFAVQPMATQFEEAICTLLDEDKFYFRFDYNGVTKVSLNSRIDAYNKQIMSGIMSPNEARAKESLPPIEAGDTFFMPVNLMPLNDETINAYMAKQKNEIAGLNPTDPDAQHFAGGDDKQ